MLSSQCGARAVLLTRSAQRITVQPASALVSTFSRSLQPRPASSSLFVFNHGSLFQTRTAFYCTASEATNAAGEEEKDPQAWRRRRKLKTKNIPRLKDEMLGVETRNFMNDNISNPETFVPYLKEKLNSRVGMTWKAANWLMVGAAKSKRPDIAMELFRTMHINKGSCNFEAAAKNCISCLVDGFPNMSSDDKEQAVKHVKEVVSTLTEPQSRYLRLAISVVLNEYPHAFDDVDNLHGKFLQITSAIMKRDPKRAMELWLEAFKAPEVEKEQWWKHEINRIWIYMYTTFYPRHSEFILKETPEEVQTTCENSIKKAPELFQQKYGDRFGYKANLAGKKSSRKPVDEKRAELLAKLPEIKEKLEEMREAPLKDVVTYLFNEFQPLQSSFRFEELEDLAGRVVMDNLDKINEAYYKYEEFMKQYANEPVPANPHVCNIIMMACANTDQALLAYETFGVLDDFNVKPDASSFDAIVYACLRGGMQSHFSHILGELFERKVRPSGHALDIILDHFSKDPNLNFIPLGDLIDYLSYLRTERRQPQIFKKTYETIIPRLIAKEKFYEANRFIQLMKAQRMDTSAFEEMNSKAYKQKQERKAEERAEAETEEGSNESQAPSESEKTQE